MVNLINVNFKFLLACKIIESKIIFSYCVQTFLLWFEGNEIDKKDKF